MEKKTKKIIVWTVIGVILLAIISFGLYFFFVNKDKAQEPDKPSVTIPLPSPSDAMTTTINFETTNQSIARAVQFDVGQADCGLVQISKDNKFETTDDNFDILVDIGVENKSSNDVKKALCDKIYNEFVRDVDLIVFSHMHFDHIGAASYFLNDNRFTFKHTTALFNWSELRYTAANSKLTSTTKTLMKTLETKKIQLADSNYWANLDAPNNKIIDFGNDNYFSVLGGTNVQIKNNPNAWSVVNKFNWKNQSILYTGDLAGNLSKQGIPIDIPSKHYPELDSDILKAPHHGSATENSNGIEFLNKVTPKEVWISAGNSDQYTLPDGAALNNYSKVGVSDVNVKGTEKFGNTKSVEQIKQGLMKDKPSLTDADAQKQAQKIFDAWKGCNAWVKAHPTANNNNNGYGDIKCDLNTISFKR